MLPPEKDYDICESMSRHRKSHQELSILLRSWAQNGHGHWILTPDEMAEMLLLHGYRKD